MFTSSRAAFAFSVVKKVYDVPFCPARYFKEIKIAMSDKAANNNKVEK